MWFEFYFPPLMAVGVLLLGWRSRWVFGPQERLRCHPVERYFPHPQLAWQAITPDFIGGRRPSIGPGQPWRPPHYFVPRWYWDLEQYCTLDSPWMVLRGGPGFSISPRGGHLYRVSRKIITRRSCPARQRCGLVLGGPFLGRH